MNWKEKNQIYDLIAEIELKENIVIDIKAYQESELRETEMALNPEWFFNIQACNAKRLV